MQIVLRDNLTERAAYLGKVLREGLLSIQHKYPDVIRDVRGRGLLQGVQVVAPPGSNVSGEEIGALVAEKAMELGLSCNIVTLKGFAGVFRIAPPLIVTEQELAKAVGLLAEAFKIVLEEMPVGEREEKAAQEEVVTTV